MTEKKRWSKPVCEKVKLVAEEAVITGCKIGTVVGPGGYAGCTRPNGVCRVRSS